MIHPKQTSQRILTVGLGVLFVLGGCDSSPDKSDKNTIRLAIESKPRTLDPRYALDANSQYITELSHCSLIGFNPDGKLQPELAKSWSWKNPRTLKLKLKEGIKFRSGTPVQAKDVRATYQFFLKDDVKEPSPRKAAFKGIEKIEAPGEHTVLFHLKKPDAAFLSNLVIGIFPKKKAGSEEIKDPDKMIGCGPYQIEKEAINEVKLVENKHYNLQPDQPKTKNIVFKVVKDESTRHAKLIRGEVGIVQNAINREKLDSIRQKQEHLKIVKRPAIKTAYLGFNFRDSITGDLAVRRAIAHAIDRQEIIKHILQGLAKPAASLLPPSNPYFSQKMEVPEYNPQKAKKILKEAGYKDPDGAEGPQPRLSLDYKTTNNQTRKTIAETIASQLKKIGIEVNVRALEWGKFKKDVEKGRVQIWSLAWVGFKDPDIFRYVFASDKTPPDGGNRGWYSNSKLDKLMKKAKRTTKKNERKKLYHRIQKMVAREKPYVFLWHEQNLAVVNASIEGFKLYADGSLSSLAKAVKKPAD